MFHFYSHQQRQRAVPKPALSTVRVFFISAVLVNVLPYLVGIVTWVSLMTDDAVSFHVLVCHLYILSGEMSIQSFACFLKTRLFYYC